MSVNSAFLVSFFVLIRLLPHVTSTCRRFCRSRRKICSFLARAKRYRKRISGTYLRKRGREGGLQKLPKYGKFEKQIRVWGMVISGDSRSRLARWTISSVSGKLFARLAATSSPAFVKGFLRKSVKGELWSEWTQRLLRKASKGEL